MKRGSKNSDRTTTRTQTGSMSSCIDPFSETTDHGPLSLGKSLTQEFRHPKGVRGWTPCPHHGNRLLRREQRQQLSVPTPLKRQWWALQAVKPSRPLRIAGQKDMTWHLHYGMRANRASVTLEGTEQRCRPFERFLQSRKRPAPEVLQTLRSLSGCRTKLAHAHRANPRALDPQPPPGALRHAIATSTSILSMELFRAFEQGSECLRYRLRRLP